MSLLWFDFSLLVVATDLEGWDVSFDLSGCSLVMVISRFSDNDGMVPILWIVDLEDP